MRGKLGCRWPIRSRVRGGHSRPDRSRSPSPRVPPLPPGPSRPTRPTGRRSTGRCSSGAFPVGGRHRHSEPSRRGCVQPTGPGGPLTQPRVDYTPDRSVGIAWGGSGSAIRYGASGRGADSALGHRTVSPMAAVPGPTFPGQRIVPEHWAGWGVASSRWSGRARGEVADRSASTSGRARRREAAKGPRRYGGACRPISRCGTSARRSRGTACTPGGPRARRQWRSTTSRSTSRTARSSR